MVSIARPLQQAAASMARQSWQACSGPSSAPRSTNSRSDKASTTKYCKVFMQSQDMLMPNASSTHSPAQSFHNASLTSFTLSRWIMRCLTTAPTTNIKARDAHAMGIGNKASHGELLFVQNCLCKPAHTEMAAKPVTCVRIPDKLLNCISRVRQCCCWSRGMLFELKGAGSPAPAKTFVKTCTNMYHKINWPTSSTKPAVPPSALPKWKNECPASYTNTATKIDIASPMVLQQ
mmetsp:Transcript_65639/g.166344  ORF Transcript_65639/g.166344 Transcript_65639/m.166344 type:complete len:233 (-) Transcript_65639:549-1247(-)